MKIERGGRGRRGAGACMPESMRASLDFLLQASRPKGLPSPSNAAG